MNDYDVLNLRQAAAHSSTHDSITHVVLSVPTPAEDILVELEATVSEDEESDWTTNGDTLEFWAFDPECERSDEMTMRVHVSPIK